MTHVLSSSPLGRCNYNIHVRSNDVGQNKIDVGISFFLLPKKNMLFSTSTKLKANHVH